MFQRKTHSHKSSLNDSIVSNKKNSISSKSKLDDKATSLGNKENNRNSVVQSDKSSKCYKRTTTSKKSSTNKKTLKKKKANPFESKELKKYLQKKREEFNTIDKYVLQEEIYIPVHDVGLLPENSKTIKDSSLPLEELLGTEDPICKLVSQSNSKEKKSKSKLKNMEDISKIVESKLKSKESVSDSEDICISPLARKEEISYDDNVVNNFDDLISGEMEDDLVNSFDFDEIDNVLENSHHSEETESNDITNNEFNDCMTEIEKLLKCIEISEKL